MEDENRRLVIEAAYKFEESKKENKGKKGNKKNSHELQTKDDNMTSVDATKP